MSFSAINPAPARLNRSQLFVLANRPATFQAAERSAADVIMFEIEGDRHDCYTGVRRRRWMQSDINNLCDCRGSHFLGTKASDRGIVASLDTEAASAGRRGT
jgi:hypothetical protein